MPYCQATLVFLNSLTLIFQTIFFALLEGPLEGPARRMDVLTYFSSKFSTNFRKQTRFFSAQLHAQNIKDLFCLSVSVLSFPLRSKLMLSTKLAAEQKPFN